MSRPPIARDKLVRHICGLGNDKNGNPISIRTADLATACDIAPGSIQAMLSGPVAAGEIYVCKVTLPGVRAFNEYRKGGGQAVPEFRPLDTRRAGIAQSTADQKPRPSTINKPQPAVGNNTGSAIPVPPASAGDRAVAARPATPKSTTRARLKEEPAAKKASAGDAFNLTIDDKGVLIIGTDEGVIELQPNDARRLGNFMLGSQGVWNPF